MFDHEMRDAAERVLHACRKRGLKLVTAESCTGGLVAATLTAIAGSSDVVERAYVTYANEAKREMLGVPWDALMGHGAVSDPVARAMAAGALARSGVDLAVSVTGVAGPGGGTPAKPVGLVHFGGATRDGRLVHREQRYGDIGRSEIRRLAVLEALDLLRTLAASQ
jgi:nicotinamide-nucleotide amidase